MAVAVPFISLFAAFGPTASPPDGNAAAPINVGSIFQTKNEGIELKGGLIASGIIDKGTLLLSPFAPDFFDSAVNTAMSQDGVIYYDSTSKKFRCYEDGAWKNCAGTNAGSGAGISGYEIIINSVTAYGGHNITVTRTAVALCSSQGKKVVGGNCDGGHGHPLINGEGWTCSVSASGIGSSAETTAYAICVEVL